LVLLDADVIIEAHELKVWDPIVSEVGVLVPSIVSHNEASYFRSRKRRKKLGIRLTPLVESGDIEELSATTDELRSIEEAFDCITLEGLHDGEKEALALLYSGRAPGSFFCSGDKAALRCLAMLGLSEKAISLETLLGSIGFWKPLSPQFTEEYLRRQLRRGQQDGITGLGLSGGGDF